MLVDAGDAGKARKLPPLARLVYCGSRDPSLGNMFAVQLGVCESRDPSW
jgi:hypothetical protein